MSDTPRKPYGKPAILHTETLTTRATTCNKADDSCAPSGSISS